MSKRHFGSINLTRLIEAAKKKHSAFKKGKEEPHDIYANVTVWENDEKDEKGNRFSITLNSTKEAREAGTDGKKVYIGNLKTAEPKNGEVETESIPADQEVITGNPLDGLPF